MTLIPAPNQSDYPALPDMEPIDVEITEFRGRHTENFTWEGKEVTKECYTAVFTPTDPALSANRIWADLTRSWDVKTGNGTAGLRNLVYALHPKDLTQEQLLEFDPDILEFFVGRKLTVLGTVNDRGRLKVVFYKRAKTVMGPATSPAQEAKAAVEEALAV